MIYYNTLKNFFFLKICIKTANVFFKVSKSESKDYQYKAHALILTHKRLPVLTHD